MIEAKPYTFLCSIFLTLSILMPDISYRIIDYLPLEYFILILLGFFY